MKKIFNLLILSSLLNAGNLSLMLSELENNEQLKAKNYEVKSLEQTSESIKRKYLPSLDIQAGFASFDLDRLLIAPKKYLNASLNLNALIYDGKRASNINLGKQNLKLSQAEEKKLKNDLRLKLTSLYFSYFALDENIIYKQKHIEYLKANLNRLEKLKQVGLKPLDELEIFRAKIELNKSELNELIYQKEELLSNIYLLTNKKITPEKGSYIALSNDTKDSFDLEISKIKTELSKLNQDLALAAFKPSIYLKNQFGFSNSKYDYERFSPFDALVKSRIKEKMRSNIFMLGFSWNIFSFGADKKNYESAKLQTLAAQQLYEFNKKQANEQLELLYKHFELAHKDVVANEKAYRAAKFAFESIEKKYRAGLLGYVEYLNALESMQGAFARLSFARAKLEIKRAEIIYQKGLELSDFVVDL